MTGRAKTARRSPARKDRPVTYEVACAIARRWPGVEESTSYGTPALKVKGRLLARLKEDGESLVVRMGFPERTGLMESMPDVFYVTDHYLNYPAVLVRLPRVRKAVLAAVLGESWRQVAPAALKRSAGAPGARKVD
jgi:hypothetical protein